MLAVFGHVDLIAIGDGRPAIDDLALDGAPLLGDGLGGQGPEHQQRERQRNSHHRYLMQED